MKRYRGPWHHHGSDTNDHDAVRAWEAGEVPADGPDWTQRNESEESMAKFHVRVTVETALWCIVEAETEQAAIILVEESDDPEADFESRREDTLVSVIECKPYEESEEHDDEEEDETQAAEGDRGVCDS